MNFSFIFLQNEHGNTEEKSSLHDILCFNSNCLIVQLKLESETLSSVGPEGTEHEVGGPLSLSLRGTF